MVTRLEPGEYFAGYQILRKLGAGGMGAVYQARDRDLPRFVALKLLSMPDGGEYEHKVRFRREADTVARLQHPNIVTVYARGEDDDRLWISMTFVDGSDVARALREGPMHPARAVRIVAETAAALDHAHETGILHRDVKPANILLADGRPERVLLTDFGIAKAIDESRQLTQHGEILASFQYAAPERLTRPGEVDPRADVYSLGCTLFHMLTGEAPYPGQNVGRIIHGHAYEPIPLPSQRNPMLPRGFDDVITRALAKEPERRYDSCSHLAWSAAQVLKQTPPMNTGPARTTDQLSGPRFATTRTAPRPGSSDTGTRPGPTAQRPAHPDTGPRPATTAPRPGNPDTGPRPNTTRTALRPVTTRVAPGSAMPPRPMSAQSGPPPAVSATPSTQPGTTPNRAGLPPTQLVTSPPPEPTGPRDAGIGTGPAPSGRGGRTARIVIGLALVTVLALVAYFLARADNGHPTASTSAAPVTTTTQPAITTTEPTTAQPTTTEAKPTTEPPYTPPRTTQPVTTQPQPKTIAIPDVVGSAIAEAKAQLEKAGFVVKEVQRDDKRTKGTVVELDPAAGTTRAAGTTVTVYISTGPTMTTITVPNLVGLSFDTAKAKLQALGWKGTLQQTTTKVTDSTKAGKILDQTPAAGASIALDAAVTVAVGMLTSSTPVSSTTPANSTPPTY
ncbi:protein kinase domain-containing protein [Nocardia concava]|uniref:protein kinase domain-containing protein n=1 Tax=Nocardia concava TaxID=257281 RepID=UPI0002DCD3E5|nr:protein kinase [Nocardia concava]